MKLTIEIPGLTASQRRHGQAASTIEAGLRRAEKEGLDELKSQGRASAARIGTDGRLPGSVQTQLIAGGFQGIMGSVAATALSIEQGRKPGQTVESELLVAWVSRKGLAGTPRSVKSHRVTGRTAAVRSAERDLAWKIALKIRERGTKALPFIVPAARAAQPKIREAFQRALQTSLRMVARG